MKEYYFLSALLPPLKMGSIPGLGFTELVSLLEQNLQESDYKQIEVIRLYTDILNLRNYWRGGALDVRGNLDEYWMVEGLATRSLFPEYVFTFTEKYETTAARLAHFSELLVSYYREEIAQAKGFLQSYLSFERDLCLVCLGFRAKKLQRDLVKELQYEDTDDELVRQIVAQKDAPFFEPPAEYQGLRSLFDEENTSPLKLQESILKIRFDWVEDKVGVDLFSLDKILAYFIQLECVETGLLLESERGNEIVDRMMKEAL